MSRFQSSRADKSPVYVTHSYKTHYKDGKSFCQIFFMLNSYAVSQCTVYHIGTVLTTCGINSIL